MKPSSLVAVVMTCHNRRDLTLRCLSSIQQQVLPKNMSLELFLMDDGSSDGTAEAVLKQWPGARILKGNGSLFWCGGMRVAWAEAAKAAPDYYFLVNDDTVFESNALQRLYEMVQLHGQMTIASAVIQNPDTQETAYGGADRDGKSLKLKAGVVQEAETLNANGALIPKAVYEKIGIFHTAYTHAMGDYDYGFMARRAGVKILLSDEYLGWCRHNKIEGTWTDTGLSRIKRWKHLQSPKGLPWPEWYIYSRRAYPLTWPIKFLTPALKILAGR